MRAGVCLSALTIAMAAAFPVQAQQGGDPRHGRVVAEDVCSGCHAIQARQVVSPNPRVPTFAELAATPGMTSAALTVAMTTPHAGMPMFRLTAQQRDDIIAYVLSLKQSEPAPHR